MECLTTSFARNVGKEYSFICSSKLVYENHWIPRRICCYVSSSTNSSQWRKSTNMAYPMSPIIRKRSRWRSFAASLNLEDGPAPSDSASSSSEQTTDADGTTNDDASEDLLARKLSSDELKALLADSERSKLLRRLSEANQYNRFLKRQLQIKDDAVVKFKGELAVLELELQALVGLAEEIANFDVPLGSRRINGKYIQSHLLSRLEAVHDKIVEQIKDVDSLKTKEISIYWVGMAEEIGTGRILGTGTMHDGLYYLDEGSDEVALATKLSSCQELLLLHRRLGHPSFATMSRSYPSLFSSCRKEDLVCDACELAKHTRVPYPSLSRRSNKPFEIIHSDVWGPCEVNSVLGHRWFVTFIDGFSRYTWLYLLKHKSDVFSVFKDLVAKVKNQCGETVKILRSDNGTEYINQEFEYFLSINGIVHQTTCVNTPEQNGVAERKNRHLLEVARSLMFTMNVPKFLWGEAIKTATYLINRMPLRVLENKTPAELLLGSNDFIVSPKVFGCVCFVHDYRNNVGKLDPRALKCVFMGYSPTQKGYRCWCPSEHRFFVSMDVTFREHEPYYGSTGDIDITLAPEVQQEGESNGILVGSILVPTSGVSHGVSQSVSNDSSSHDHGVNLHSSQEEELNSDSSPNSCRGDMQGDTPSHDIEPLMHGDPECANYGFIRRMVPG